jgi:erythromycin esterase-like protein
VLSAVAATSACDVWAVGSYDNVINGIRTPDQTLIEHWDGQAWTVIPSPDLGTHDFLSGVAAVTANDAWAVGDYYKGNRLRDHTLIEHWDGQAWAVVPSPDPGTSDALRGVAAVSATDAWAVGGYGRHNPSRTLIEHWNGKLWKVVPTPHPHHHYVSAVAAVSAKNAWAVGYRSGRGGAWTLIEHWNGKAWKVVPSPSRSASPEPVRRDLFYGVAAVSAKDAWAVGTYNHHRRIEPLIAHWNGKAWKVVPSPHPAVKGFKFSQLFSVAAVSAKHAWAVGSYPHHGGFRTLIERWNGKRWKQVPSPNPAGYYNELSGVAAVSANDAWAVGAYRHGSGPDQTLVEHWNGKAWSR